MKEFMNKRVQDMTVGETIKYNCLKTGAGIVLSLIIYGVTCLILKVKGEI